MTENNSDSQKIASVPDTKFWENEWAKGKISSDTLEILCNPTFTLEIVELHQTKEIDRNAITRAKKEIHELKTTHNRIQKILIFSIIILTIYHGWTTYSSFRELNSLENSLNYQSSKNFLLKQEKEDLQAILRRANLQIRDLKSQSASTVKFKKTN